MEGSGSEFSEAKTISWARKVELPIFNRSIKEGTNLKGSSFKCDSDPLQFLKSENRSKKVSVIKNHTLCVGEETKNDEAELAREKKISNLGWHFGNCDLGESEFYEFVKRNILYSQ